MIFTLTLIYLNESTFSNPFNEIYIWRQNNNIGNPDSTPRTIHSLISMVFDLGVATLGGTFFFLGVAKTNNKEKENIQPEK